MSLEFKISVDPKGLGEFKKSMGGLPIRLTKNVRSTLKKEGSFLSGAVSRAAGTKLKVRTGTLRRGWHDVVLGTILGNLKLIIFTDVKYAPTHEYGATITPRKAKMLAIPLPAAQTGAGVSRYASPLRQHGPPMFMIKSRRGNLLLMSKESKQPLFVLKKKVRIPKRPYILPTIKKELPKVKKGLDKAVEDAISARG